MWDCGVCVVCRDTIHVAPGGHAPDADAAVRLSGCTHLFHDGCISAWARITNRCPLCNARFAHVCIVRADERCATVVKGVGAGEAGVPLRVVATRHVPHRDQKPACAAGPELDTVCCGVCGRGDREDVLLLCDGDCGGAAHTFCVGISHVPHGDWWCSLCRPRASQPPPQQQLPRATTCGEREAATGNAVPTCSLARVGAAAAAVATAAAAARNAVTGRLTGLRHPRGNGTRSTRGDASRKRRRLRYASDSRHRCALPAPAALGGVGCPPEPCVSPRSPASSGRGGARAAGVAKHRLRSRSPQDMGIVHAARGLLGCLVAAGASSRRLAEVRQTLHRPAPTPATVAACLDTVQEVVRRADRQQKVRGCWKAAFGDQRDVNGCCPRRAAAARMARRRLVAKACRCATQRPRTPWFRASNGSCAHPGRCSCPQCGVRHPCCAARTLPHPCPPAPCVAAESVTRTRVCWARGCGLAGDCRRCACVPRTGTHGAGRGRPAHAWAQPSGRSHGARAAIRSASTGGPGANVNCNPRPASRVEFEHGTRFSGTLGTRSSRVINVPRHSIV